MYDQTQTNLSRNLSSICLAGAPAGMFIGSLIMYLSPENYFVAYIFSKVGIGLFVFAIFAVVQMLRPHLEKTALIAGGMAILGAINGATLYSFGYFFRVMSHAGADQATTGAFERIFREVYLTVVQIPLPGIFFPLGLLILAVGLFRSKLVPAGVAVLLALAAISFPMGRIPANPLICLITDLLLTVSLGLIAWQTLNPGAPVRSLNPDYLKT
ncbi:MAG: hypothetical protein R2747_08315 [Pyrinomonadaceae bacterium]